jgi:uncharacterized membrane protein YqiK
MSEELTTLQTTATEAKAKADELKAALTEASTDEDRAAATTAEDAAVAAEAAFAEAKAKADAEAGDGSGEVTPKAGDVCTLEDGTEGVQTEQADGSLVCEAKKVEEEDASRTGYVKGAGVKQGDSCTCPDGREGTVTIFADGLAVCLPNQG